MINTQGFFTDIFKNARENSVIILNVKGEILHVNKGFMAAFGYKLNDLSGKHFRILFTEKDRLSRKPEREVSVTLAKGSKSDNNYLVNKKGDTIWVMGESVLVSNIDKEKFIVKIIQDIHAQKRLEHFLVESTEFLDIIFDSIKDTSLIVLDSSIRIIKTNKAFVKMFGLTAFPETGTKLSQVDNFWKGTAIKTKLLDLLIKQHPIKNEVFSLKDKKGKEITISINAKLMEKEGREKRILLVLKYLR